MSRTTKASAVLSTWNDTEVLMDLLLFAQSALVAEAEKLSQLGAVSGASVCIALASRAYTLTQQLKTEMEMDHECLLEQ